MLWIQRSGAESVIATLQFIPQLDYPVSLNGKIIGVISGEDLSGSAPCQKPLPIHEPLEIDHGEIAPREDQQSEDQRRQTPHQEIDQYSFQEKCQGKQE
jgi:hypothetical protein